MQSVINIADFDFDSVKIDSFWNTGTERELAMHRIHSYPAKFPAFITQKAIQYARNSEMKVRHVADVFCGCGTTAFEARRSGLDFWGCDINPVATLIAKVKGRKYQQTRLKQYLGEITRLFDEYEIDNEYRNAGERFRYWHKKKQYNELLHLKWAIDSCTPPASAYRLFFHCAFSNILKQTSVWLTKSIKPQVDPIKKPSDVRESFLAQSRFMITANSAIGDLTRTKSKIITGNFLSDTVTAPRSDLIVTSPPYVTSYEYADLHQLSSMWLGYSSDYRTLREGSIGSLQHDYSLDDDSKLLNSTGQRIVKDLKDQDNRKARSVAKYFSDMQSVARKTFSILRPKGLALFVIGNTEYMGVRINNAKHLAESLLDAGFSNVRTAKRKISKKILTPYRDKHGRFSTNSKGRKVYGEEFILLGEK